MSKTKRLILSVIGVLSAFCFILGGYFTVASVKAASLFSGVEIIGAQVRLDQKDIRFVMAMNQADYSAYTASKQTSNKYVAGILTLSENGIGEELTVATEGVSNYVFADDYSAKEVTEGGVKEYRFIGKLNAVPDYSENVIARGYVYDGSIYHYTPAVIRNVSYVASKYYQTLTDVEYKDIAEDYVVNGYNEIASSKGWQTANSITTMQPAISLNDTNTLISTHPTEKTANVNLNGLEEIMEITVSSANTGVVTVSENVTVTASATGSTTISVNGLGVKLGDINVTVIDDTLIKIGSGYAGTGYDRYVNYSSASDFANSQLKVAKESNIITHMYGITNTAQYLTEAKGRTATSDKMLAMTVSGLNMDEHYSFRPRYTKEQIGILLAAGYDTIELNVYTEVLDDVNGLQNSVLGGRDFISAYTPKYNITGQAVNMGYEAKTSNSNQYYVNLGRYNLNQWNVLRLSLKTLYDNWEQMAFTGDYSNYKGVSNGTYAQKKWGWFALINEMYGVGPQAYTRTIYIDDIKVVDSDLNNQYAIVNTTSASFTDSILGSQDDCYNAAFISKTNSYQALYAGRTQTTVAGRTGDFTYLSSIRADYGVPKSYDDATYNGNRSPAIYLDLGYTKDQLTYMEKAGAVYLSIDFCIDIEKNVNNVATYGETGGIKTYTYFGKSGTAGALASNVFPKVGEPAWVTWKLPVENLIENYDAYFDKDSATREPIMHFYPDGNLVLTVYFDKIQLVDGSGNVAVDQGDYILEEATRVANAVKAAQTGNTYSILAISDTHYNGTTLTQQTTQDAVDAISYIKSMVDIDTYSVLGDLINGGPQDLDVAKETANLKAVTDMLASAIGTDVNQMWTIGNHDTLAYSDTVEKITNESHQEYVFDRSTANQGAERGYGYYDDTAKKTRVININTSDMYGITWAHEAEIWMRISPEQLQWLIDVALDTSTLTDDWNIIVVSHVPIDSTGSSTTPTVTDAVSGVVYDVFNINKVLTVFNAFKNKSSGSVVIDGITIDFDFADAKNINVTTIHGHNHNYDVNPLLDSDIIQVGVPNASPNGTDSTNKVDGTTETFNKTLGTKNSTSFVVITIDLDTGKITTTHYGAGYSYTYPTN